MTKHKPFDMRRRGFTEMEAMYVVPMKTPPIVPLWLRIVVGLSLAVILIHLFVLPLLPIPAARAEAPEEVIRQNDYYCRQIQDGVPRVVGADHSAVAALCAEYL